MSQSSQLPNPLSSTWAKVGGVVASLAIALSLLVLTFAAPAAGSRPAELTVAVTGEPELVQPFMTGVATALSGVAELHQVDTLGEAQEGIENREFIGAVELAAGSPRVFTAAAAGQVPTAVMQRIAEELQNTVGEQLYVALRTTVQQSPDPQAALVRLPEALPSVTVVDVAPYSAEDPSGAGLVAAGIPLTVGALLGGILISFTVRGRWQRLTAVLLSGALGGLLLAWILQTWLQVYPGGFSAVWLALGVSLTATMGVFVGLHGLLGRAGLGVGALLTLFAAMPWAAFAVPPAFLPGGLGAVGQWLIPGATATLTRSLSYFPDAATAQQWWALGLWLAGAVVLLLVARAPQRSVVAAPLPA